MTVDLVPPLIPAPLAENRSIISHPAFSWCSWSAPPQEGNGSPPGKIPLVLSRERRVPHGSLGPCTHPSPVLLLLAQGELQSGEWAEQTGSQRAPRIEPARPSPVCVHALCDFSLGRICIWSFVLQSFCFVHLVFVLRGWGVQSSRSICIYLF